MPRLFFSAFLSVSISVSLSLSLFFFFFFFGLSFGARYEAEIHAIPEDTNQVSSWIYAPQDGEATVRLPNEPTRVLGLYGNELPPETRTVTPQPVYFVE